MSQDGVERYPTPPCSLSPFFPLRGLYTISQCLLVEKLGRSGRIFICMGRIFIYVRDDDGAGRESSKLFSCIKHLIPLFLHWNLMHILDL